MRTLRSPKLLSSTILALSLAWPLASARADDGGSVSASDSTRQDRSLAQAAWSPIRNTADAIAKGSMAIGQTMKDEVLRMRDFFGVVLPGAADKYRFSLDFEPKAGDLLRRDYVRYPMVLHYGLAERWEIYGGATPISPNPFKNGPENEWSLGEGKLGIRYDFPPNTWKLQRVTVGYEMTDALGRPPIELIDQYIHLHPYVTTACPIVGLEDTTLLVSLSYDRAVGPDLGRDRPPDYIRRHVLELAPGILYKPGEYGSFFQFGVRLLDEPTQYRLGKYAKIGGIWDVPMAKSRRWHLPGKWQVEVGYKITHEEGTGVDQGVYARVKWRTDFFKKKWKELTGPSSSGTSSSGAGASSSPAAGAAGK